MFVSKLGQGMLDISVWLQPPFPQDGTGGSLSLGAPKHIRPVLSADFTTPYNQLRPCNSQLFCTRFPHSFPAVQSTILHYLHSVLQDFFSFPNLCMERDQPNLLRHKDIKKTWWTLLKTVWRWSNSTASCTLISLFSVLRLKWHSVQLIALKVRFFSSRKLSKITLLFCLQLLFINAPTWGSSQLQIEVYKDTRHTKIWYN